MTVIRFFHRARPIVCTVASVVIVGLVAVGMSSSIALAEKATLIEDEISDPLEGLNRGVFWFNDKFDRYLFEPVAKGYDYVMPNSAQRGVVNVFDNLRYPVFLVSDVVQFKFDQAADHTGRFLINSTLGLAGLFDVASELGLEPHQEDFGTALAEHGVPQGPYLMLPILGPSTLRDGFGRVVDLFLNPVPWVADATASSSDATAITFGAAALDGIQTRADLIDAIETAREASIDYYLFTQTAYYQYRRAVVEDRSADPVTGESTADPFAEDELLDQQLAE